MKLFANIGMERIPRSTNLVGIRALKDALKLISLGHVSGNYPAELFPQADPRPRQYTSHELGNYLANQGLGWEKHKQKSMFVSHLIIRPTTSISIQIEMSADNED